MLGAQNYWDIFGGEADSVVSIDMKHYYRRMAHVLQPHQYAGKSKVMAERAYQRLNEFFAEAEQANEGDRYGEPAHLAVITTRRGEHTILRELGTGDLCTTYVAESVLTTTKATFCKVAKREADKDLLLTEAKVLKHLRDDSTDPTLRPFAPELLDSFVYTSAGNPRRAANVLVLLDGFYNLEQVRQAYPSGLDPLHAVWIWRRLLVAIGHAHDNHVVHGAVLPGHVMIHPEMHGLVLVDWCYASSGDSDAQPAIKAVVEAYRDWYPAEVLAKQEPGPGTDIAMAARTMIWLLGGDPVLAALPRTIPRQLRAFLRGCLQKNLAMRPDDAWRLLAEFDELLEEMGSPYYPRRFRPFTMPTGTV